MQELHAKHLIVGGGLLGLSIANELLHRQQDGIFVIDRHSDPLRSSADARELVLSTGIPEYTEIEKRGIEKLQELQDLSGSDLGYHPEGSVEVPVLLEPEDATILDGSEAMKRASGLNLDDMDSAILHEVDGSVLIGATLTSLASRLREGGGTYANSQEVLFVEEDTTGFRFGLSAREGTAERVYLAAGASNPGLLSSLGVECGWKPSSFHTFELSLNQSQRSMVRFQEADLAVARHDGVGELTLVASEPHSGGTAEPSVRWPLLEALREREAERYPGLVQATVRRARAELHLDLDTHAPGIISAHEGRVLAAGAYGLHRFPLALAVAEMVVTMALADLP